VADARQGAARRGVEKFHRCRPRGVATADELEPLHRHRLARTPVAGRDFGLADLFPLLMLGCHFGARGGDREIPRHHLAARSAGADPLAHQAQSAVSRDEARTRGRGEGGEEPGAELLRVGRQVGWRFQAQVEIRDLTDPLHPQLAHRRRGRLRRGGH
jgi:hypothetical protein